jgi:hypothetical protein
VWGQLRKCWRGEFELPITLVSALALAGAINLSFRYVQRYASALSWPTDIQSAIGTMAFVGSVGVVVWFAVSIWRSARRSFLLGNRFWPIVASLGTAVAVGAYVLAFLDGYFKGIR